MAASSEYQSDNQRAKDFRVFMGLSFSKTLSIDELRFFEPLYNRYSLDELQDAVNLYIDQQKDKRFLKIPSPKILAAILSRHKQEQTIKDLGSEYCRICKGTGEALLLWAGNNRSTKFNWHTKENPDGMRIVKERGDWEYAQNSVCPCSCVNGHKKFLKGKRAESWEAIRKLTAFFQTKPLYHGKNKMDQELVGLINKMADQ